STLHPDVRLALPKKAALDRLNKLNEEALARSLGLAEKGKDKKFDRSTLKIRRQQWYIYRYDSAQRVRMPVDPGHEHPKHLDRFPDLPPVDDEIKDGEHYLVAAVSFSLGTADIPDLPWLALVEAKTLSVLLLRAFVASVNGLVFVQDPITTNAGPPPNAGDAQLNPLRRSVLLP